MKKRVIKVIKPGAGNALPQEPSAEAILIQQQQDKAEDDRDLASNVKNWITERRENSLVEASDASDSRKAWHDKNSPKKK